MKKKKTKQRSALQALNMSNSRRLMIKANFSNKPKSPKIYYDVSKDTIEFCFKNYKQFFPILELALVGNSDIGNEY